MSCNDRKQNYVWDIGISIYLFRYIYITHAHTQNRIMMNPMLYMFVIPGGILIIGIVFSYLIYQYYYKYRRYTFQESYSNVSELNIVLNDIEGGKVTPSKEYLPPQVVENYISSAKDDKSNNTGANNVVNRENRTRSQSAVWKKERELARNTLLKIEQDENKFKVASEKIVESNTEADEELINLRFEELQRQSLGIVGTPVQPHSGKNNGSSSSNEKVASIDNNNISISSTPESLSTPTTKLNRLMGTNQKDKPDNNAVQHISTPTSKLNKLMNNDNDKKLNNKKLIDDANSSTPTTRLSFLYNEDGNNNNQQKGKQEVEANNNSNNDNNPHKKKKKKKKKKKNK